MQARRIVAALAIASILVAACGTSEQTTVDSELVGTWRATVGNPIGVIAAFNADGTSTWSNGDLESTYEADGSTLTFSNPDDSPFCAGGTLTWEYEIDGDTLTADVVAADCPEGAFDLGPPSPDWIFVRE
ncbi:MAG TPA: hypothetical protein VF071_10905 [Candidatus Limnocylindria bacterium]